MGKVRSLDQTQFPGYKKADYLIFLDTYPPALSTYEVWGLYWAIRNLGSYVPNRLSRNARPQPQCCPG